MRDFTLVFDLDGTLVDTAPDLVAATNHALADLGLPPVPARALRPYIGFGARRMIVEALRRSASPPGDSEVDRLLGRFLVYYEENIAAESRPYAEAVTVLRGLRNAGARLAVCTNKREALSRKLLGVLDIDHMFSALAGRDTFAVHKPDPEHLLGTIRLAGGVPERAVMIGDTTVDIATARAARVPVIACSFGYSDVPVNTLAPDHVIDTFAALEPALSALVHERAHPASD
jgi:phosphoglycolate phosphatase